MVERGNACPAHFDQDGNMEEGIDMVALAQRATEKLQEPGFLRAMNLVVIAEGDTLVITGRVHSFHQKQMAQETIRPLLKPGVTMVNRVTVE